MEQPGTAQNRSWGTVRIWTTSNQKAPEGSVAADEFSTLLDDGRTDVVGSAEDYAIRKSKNFPSEGGPAVVVIDVPDGIVDLTFDAYLPRSQGLVQFDRGAEALRQLLEAWPGLTKEIRQVRNS